MSYVIDALPDRADALYGVGERITFSIRIEPAARVAVRWQLSNDGWRPLAKGTVETVDGVAAVTTRLDEPGFVRLEVTVSGVEPAVTAVASAGVAPHLIKPSAAPPVDFDTFWDKKLAALSAVAADPQLTPVDAGVEGIDAWDVQVNSIGAPVSGYLARPQKARARSLPAILTFHGAGVRSAGLGAAVGWAKEGAIAMDVNAHGIANGRPDAYYSQLAQGTLSEYWLRGRESRDTFYFLGMFLRVVRAIDFVTAQPEWDGKTVVVYGTSQGGAQALAGAALDPRVTFVVAGVTAMANIGGKPGDVPSGWPDMRSDLLQLAQAESEAMVRTFRYFDSVNFAARSRADGFFTVGFLDMTCRPTTVYAAYNAFPGKKAIFNDLRAAHENTPEALRRMHEAVLHHLDQNM